MVAGIALLATGSDFVVEAASRIARRLGISSLVIGLTLTSIGTSVPEIATNVAVGVNTLSGGVDASGIAVGNIIGSNLSQITLLLGITALVMPLKVPREVFVRDGPMAMAALVAMYLICLDGIAQRWEGVLTVVIYVAYLAWVLYSRRVAPGDDTVPGSLAADIAIVAAGIAVIVFAADLVVDNGVLIARQFSLSDTVIGLGVGLGTGLPELTIAIKAAVKKDTDMSLGNLLGSNITDPLLSFGLGVAVHPVQVTAAALTIDFPVWFGASVLALGLLATDRLLTRAEGIVLIGVFVTYLLCRL